MIKSVVARGIGFSPGTVSFVVTHGFGSAAAGALAMWMDDWWWAWGDSA